MSEQFFYFERLTVWQVVRDLVRQVYDVTALFPREERYGLSDQLRRAAVSVASNIAESSGRLGDKDRARFLDFACGSLMEVRCQLLLAQDIHLMDVEQVQNISRNIVEIYRMISAMRKNLSTEKQ